MVIFNGYSEFAYKIASIVEEIEFTLLNVFQESLLYGNLSELLSYFNIEDI